MPKNFKTIKRLLSENEKYERAINYYTEYSFSLDTKIYYTDDFKIDISKTLDELDCLTKNDILNFVKEDIYDEEIHLKCLNCNYDEIIDYDIIRESFYPGDDYPISYCPNCSKPKFVPLDIYNKKKL